MEIPELLFLVGYSNGGYASLALHQFIEEEGALEVTETFVGAGAYDKTTFSKSILSSDQNLDFLGTYLWVLDVYNKTYPDLNRPWDFYLNKTYTNLIPVIDQLMDLPDAEMNPTVLFTPEFMTGIVNETDHAFIAALEENQSTNWNWQAPIHFFRGSEDSLLSPINTLLASQTIENAGGQVDTTILIGEDHESVILPFTLNILKEINYDLY